MNKTEIRFTILLVSTLAVLFVLILLVIMNPPIKALPLPINTIMWLLLVNEMQKVAKEYMDNS